MVSENFSSKPLIYLKARKFIVFAYDALKKKIQVLLHILVLFKNGASLPLGKKNEQSPTLFTQKSPNNFAVTWQTTNREAKNVPSHKSDGLLVKCTSTPW